MAIFNTLVLVFIMADVLYEMYRTHIKDFWDKSSEQLIDIEYESSLDSFKVKRRRIKWLFNSHYKEFQSKGLKGNS